MKRFLACVLVTILLLAGCGAKEPTTVATISPGPATVTVSSVDEFLAALAPHTQILLKPGCYDLSTASDYGEDKEDSFYTWVDIGDGYQLTVRDAEELEIRSDGAAEFVTAPRYANVLHFQNCRDLTLFGFRAGHTDGGECAGGVIHLQDCNGAQLEHLSLYGCGTTGIRADRCRDVLARCCEIYECSSNGIQADGTDGLQLEDCVFHDLGTDQFAAGQVFWLRQCTNVTVQNCSVLDNRVLQIVNSQPAAGIELRQCSFTRNEIQSSVFALNGGGLVMDSCVFNDNDIRSWFDSEDGTVLDGIGKSWDEEMLDVWYDPPVETMPAGEREEVVVSTVDELIAAIAPNREIVLKDGIYDLSTAGDYGTGWGEYYYWSEEFDGPELVIWGVENLVIRSESGDWTTCTVSAVPRYADVLSFQNSTGITVSGITAGHTVEPGYCMGGVLNFGDCDGILVERCSLYGCGILGVQAELCSTVAVTGCEIYECSYGGIQMGNTSGISIEGCSFRDLGGDAMYFYQCRDVVVDGQSVSGNGRLNY